MDMFLEKSEDDERKDSHDFIITLSILMEKAETAGK